MPATERPTPPNHHSDATSDTGPSRITAEDRTPPRHPCEDIDAGLYLPPYMPVVTMSTATRPHGASVFTDPEVRQDHYVHAVDFMEVQRERDELRRALGFINAWRMTPGRTEDRLRAVLASVGQTEELGSAILGIIREFQNTPRTADSDGL